MRLQRLFELPSRLMFRQLNMTYFFEVI